MYRNNKVRNNDGQNGEDEKPEGFEIPFGLFEGVRRGRRAAGRRFLCSGEKTGFHFERATRFIF